MSSKSSPPSTVPAAQITFGSTFRRITPPKLGPMLDNAALKDQCVVRPVRAKGRDAEDDDPSIIRPRSSQRPVNVCPSSYSLSIPAGCMRVIGVQHGRSKKPGPQNRHPIFPRCSCLHGPQG